MGAPTGARLDWSNTITSRSCVGCRILFVGATALTAPPLAAQGQVDLAPYVGVYVPTASLTPAQLLKQTTSVSLGSRLTMWLPGRMAIEFTVNYAPSDVTGIGAYSGAYRGPSAAHVMAGSAKALVRLGSPDAAAAFHVGGGLAIVDHGGPAYNYGDLQSGSASFGGIVAGGATFRLASLAMRLDAEDYVFIAHFQCSYNYQARGVCAAVNLAGNNSSSKLQNDLVLSLGLAIHLARKSMRQPRFEPGPSAPVFQVSPASTPM